MANKNRNLILSYFPTAEAADKAGDHLKQWDKDNKDVKLGGMGILTIKDGKLKTHKVGRRAGGTGAKWGLILGAAAGILSGGITLVGGALAGLAAGAVGGSLFHKKLGMTDDDKARLENHLADGGAALAVMVDDDELEPTRAEIYSLGGQVEHYVVPEETMDELEGTAEEAELADVDDGEVVEVETVAGAAAMATAVRSLSDEDAEKLQAAAIDKVEDLLERAATPKGRQELADQLGVDTATVLKWANDLDLARVKGIGVKYSDLLEQAGVDTVPELAQRNPANLTAKLAEVNEEKQLVKEAPSEKQVESWVAQAKELPRVITY
jgi:uncharacterized membrane protein/predicted flap endonuclease-1-like 5' DNA nuclease